ncbi:MAG TPA: hypothetical protein QGF58_03610 [Myxococcota bacterium]|nr:hypothetical protein [Myxococcota bacterium]
MGPGERVGRWTLLEPLGTGAFGVTWRASAGAGRDVALKLIDRAPGEELRALSRICHQDVVQLIDAGSRPPHLVMELAPGEPLSLRLK